MKVPKGKEISLGNNVLSTVDYNSASNYIIK